jgi:hypothetical protein
MFLPCMVNTCPMKRTIFLATVVAVSSMLYASSIGKEASAKCIGEKNCKACKHCKKDGGKCGVCK